MGCLLTNSKKKWFGVRYSFTNIHLFDMKLLSCKSDTTYIYLEIVCVL